MQKLNQLPIQLWVKLTVKQTVLRGNILQHSFETRMVFEGSWNFVCYKISNYNSKYNFLFKFFISSFYSNIILQALWTHKQFNFYINSFSNFLFIHLRYIQTFEINFYTNFQYFQYWTACREWHHYDLCYYCNNNLSAKRFFLKLSRFYKNTSQTSLIELLMEKMCVCDKFSEGCRLNCVMRQGKMGWNWCIY